LPFSLNSSPISLEFSAFSLKFSPRNQKSFPVSFAFDPTGVFACSPSPPKPDPRLGFSFPAHPESPSFPLLFFLFESCLLSFSPVFFVYFFLTPGSPIDHNFCQDFIISSSPISAASPLRFEFCFSPLPLALLQYQPSFLFIPSGNRVPLFGHPPLLCPLTLQHLFRFPHLTRSSSSTISLFFLPTYSPHLFCLGLFFF